MCINITINMLFVYRQDSCSAIRLKDKNIQTWCDWRPYKSVYKSCWRQRYLCIYGKQKCLTCDRSSNKYLHLSLQGPRTKGREWGIERLSVRVRFCGLYGIIKVINWYVCVHGVIAGTDKYAVYTVIQFFSFCCCR